MTLKPMNPTTPRAGLRTRTAAQRE